jgi:bacterioferritin-associated ferredoxin
VYVCVCVADGGWTYPEMAGAEESEEPATKRSRCGTDVGSEVLRLDLFDARPFFVDDGLEQVRLRMEAVDAQREVVIKKARDVQKLSKQAIFSLQGGRCDEAANKLMKARDVALEIYPIVSEVMWRVQCRGQFFILIV